MVWARTIHELCLFASGVCVHCTCSSGYMVLFVDIDVCLKEKRQYCSNWPVSLCFRIFISPIPLSFHWLLCPSIRNNLACCEYTQSSSILLHFSLRPQVVGQETQSGCRGTLFHPLHLHPFLWHPVVKTMGNRHPKGGRVLSLKKTTLLLNTLVC